MIVVEKYNPNWKLQFQELKKKIWPIVKPWAKSMEHVGSTSVVGLAAKPIIDMDIILEDFSCLDSVIKALNKIGYEHRGDLGIQYREAFQTKKSSNPNIQHNLYVCLDGCLALKNHLVLRDHLRNHKEDREAYSKIKMKLANTHPDDIDSYLDGKTELILGILDQYEFDKNEISEILSVNKKKMKYYEMHENAYQDLKEKKFVSWDRKTDVQDLFSHEINLNLKKKISKYFPRCDTKSALDIGTGTGTAAIYLKKIGFNSKGVDVSETAIAMAKDNAKSLNLEINFECLDFLNDEIQGKYDLVIDSSFLHCIVHDEERSLCLDKIKNLLNDKGVFFLHTMIESKDMSEIIDRDYLILKDEVLWSTGPDHWNMDWSIVQDKKVFAHRRIRSEQNLLKELSANGLKILSSEINIQKNNPSTFIAWLGKSEVEF